jgi:Tol biopolymer transport system component
MQAARDVSRFWIGQAFLELCRPEPSNDMCASWSPDGKWVYFHSARSGRAEIWKVPAQGGMAIQVTFDGGFHPRLSSKRVVSRVTFDGRVMAMFTT